MKVWRKFWFLLILTLILVLIQFSMPEIGHLEFSLANREFSIGIYAILTIWVFIWLICFSLKSFFIWFISLFFRNKTAEELKSVNGLAALIVADDFDFSKNFEKTFVTENMNILKIALAIKRGISIKTFDKTGLHCVDIYLIKSDLEKYIKNGNIDLAVNLASKVIKSYSENVLIVFNDILEIAKLAKKNNISFCFDPSKFKYNLPQSYIEQYNYSLEFQNFELESDFEKKLKIIEKLRKTYPSNISVLIKYLDFAFENSIEEKKILHAVKEILHLNPDRQIAEYLLKTNRKDIFELAQSYMANVCDKNLEKLWILLTMATKLDYIHIAKDLIYKIIELDHSDELYKFYIKNQTILSKDEDIALIIAERLK